MTAWSRLVRVFLVAPDLGSAAASASTKATPANLPHAGAQ